MRRPLTIGELALHFGLELIDVEWLLYRQVSGVSRSELVEEIQTLECSLEEAERLATHLRELAPLYQVCVLSEPTGRQR